MATQFPIIFCNEYTDCSPIIIEPPFGLPSYTFNNPCCKGLDTLLADLNGLMGPLTPILKVLNCFLTLIEIVTAIPDILTKLPSPDALKKAAQLVDKVAKFVTDCVPYLLSLPPVLPPAIIQFARFIRGIMQMLISILSCLKRAFTVLIQINLDIFQLNASNDDYLKQMGLCLDTQGQTAASGLRNILNALLSPFTLINALIGAIPPLADLLQQNNLYPITPVIPVLGSPGDIIDLTWIDDLIGVLSAIETVANIAALGS